MLVMDDEKALIPISILPYDRNHWRILWELRHHQLAEVGIIVSPEEIPDEPMNVGRDDYEWVLHHIDEVFLRGAGGFWLAWWEKNPAGHIGGQDFEGTIELRRMYVRAEYRRRGIATRLIQALLDHCKTQSIKAVELWTAENGLGRRLYEKMGFHITSAPGNEFSDLVYRTNFNPGKDQIRMRLDF